MTKPPHHTKWWLCDVWDCRVMRSVCPDPPPHFHLSVESDNLNPDLAPSPVSLETSARCRDRDQELSFYCGQERKWLCGVRGVRGVTIPRVRLLTSCETLSHQPPPDRAPMLERQWDTLLLTELITTLTLPLTPPPPHLQSGSIVVEKTFAGPRRVGASWGPDETTRR